MTAVTVADLDNAKLDCDHIAEIATSLADTATDRMGHTKLTVVGAMNRLTFINFRGPWATATAYAVKDAFSEGGFTYVAVLAHTSTSIAADLAAGKIALYQGIVSQDLDEFYAPADFTPGTTTQLTLSREPGSKNNAEIFFGAAYQGPNHWSLSGDVVTFDAAIPLGVEEIFVKIGVAQAAITPSSRSVGDDQLAWGDSLARDVSSIAALKALNGSTYTRAQVLAYHEGSGIGGGHFWMDPTDTTSADNGGTVIVANDGKRWKRVFVMANVFDVTEWGAKGDWNGTTGNDDTAAARAAVAACPAGGRVIFPLRHKLTDDIPVDRAITICGQGAANPIAGAVTAAYDVGATIIQTNTAKAHFRLVARLENYEFGQYGILGVRIESINLRGPSIASKSLAAVACDTSINGGDYHVRHNSFYNVNIVNVTRGIDLEGIAYLNAFDRVVMTWVDIGFRFARGAASDNPGQNRLTHCSVTQANYGASCGEDASAGSYSFFACTFSESKFGLRFGEECQYTIEGCEFEALTGDAESAGIWVNIQDPLNPNTGASHCVVGNKFLTSTRDIYLRETSGAGGLIRYPMLIDANTFGSSVALESSLTIDQQCLVFGAANAGPNGDVEDSQLVNFAGADYRKFPALATKIRTNSRVLSFSFIGGSSADHIIESIDVPNGDILYLTDIIRYSINAGTGARGNATLQAVDAAGNVRLDLFGNGTMPSSSWTNSTGVTQTIRIRTNAGGTTDPYHIQAFMRVE